MYISNTQMHANEDRVRHETERQPTRVVQGVQSAGRPGGQRHLQHREHFLKLFICGIMWS